MHGAALWLSLRCRLQASTTEAICALWTASAISTERFTGQRAPCSHTPQPKGRVVRKARRPLRAALSERAPESGAERARGLGAARLLPRGPGVRVCSSRAADQSGSARGQAVCAPKPTYAEYKIHTSAVTLLECALKDESEPRGGIKVAQAEHTTEPHSGSSLVKSCVRTRISLKVYVSNPTAYQRLCLSNKDVVPSVSSPLGLPLCIEHIIKTKHALAYVWLPYA